MADGRWPLADADADADAGMTVEEFCHKQRVSEPRLYASDAAAKSGGISCRTRSAPTSK